MKGLIFTYLLTIMGSYYGFFRPVYGAGIYIALSILKPPALWHWSVPIGRYSFYVAVSTLIGWARNSFGDWAHLQKVRRVVNCFIGYGAIQWVSAWFSRFSQDPSMWYACQKLTNDMLMVVVAASLITTFKELRIFTWIIVAAAGYVAYEMNYSYYVEDYNRIWYAEFAAIDNNGMAMIFAMVVPVALGLGLAEKKFYAKVASWIWMPFLANAVFLASSRGAMLGLCFAAPFLVWLLPNKTRTYWILAGAIIFTLVLAGPSVQDRFWSIFVNPVDRDSSTQSRITSWAAAIRAIQDNPWLGVGPRCWHRVAHGYGLDGLTIHNVFLQVGADTGIFSSIFLLGIYLLPIRALLKERAARALYSPWYPFWSAGIIAGIATGFMCGQFLGMERVEMPYYLSLLGMAAVKVASAEDRSPAPMTTVEELDMLRRSRAAPVT